MLRFLVKSSFQLLGNVSRRINAIAIEHILYKQYSQSERAAWFTTSNSKYPNFLDNTP